jgi:surface protein
MSQMFASATNYDRYIAELDVSNVLDMSNMFADATRFNNFIRTWDTSKVTTMSGMFRNAIVFKENIDDWNVSSVTDMSSMFAGASRFNRLLTCWDVSRVTNMSQMFYNATTYNRNLYLWNISSVSDMTEMFAYAQAFNKSLCPWGPSMALQNTSASNMFQNTACPSTDPPNVSILPVSPLCTTSCNLTISAGTNACGTPCTAVFTNKVDLIEAILSYQNEFGYHGNINNWCFPEITDLSELFFDNDDFNVNISCWDVSHVNTTISARDWNLECIAGHQYVKHV